MNNTIVCKYKNLFIDLFSRILPLENEDRIVSKKELENYYKEIMVSLIISYQFILESVSGENMDCMEATYIINRLMVEYLMEHGYMKDLDEDDLLKELDDENDKIECENAVDDEKVSNLNKYVEQFFK